MSVLDLKCPICSLMAQPATSGPDDYRWICPRCVSFRISATADAMYSHDSNWGADASATRARASSWIRENRPQGVLTDVDIARLVQLHPLSVEEETIKVLRAVRDSSPVFGALVEIQASKDEWLARTWCRRSDELLALVDDLEKEGLLEVQSRMHGYNGITRVRMSLKGSRVLESQGGPSPDALIGFIAMAFRDELRCANEVLH